MIIDGNYFAHRFFHGRPALRGRAGHAVGMLHAYARFLDSLAQHPACSHWALVLDAAEPSFRHQRFPAYKAHRPAMPEDLARQLTLLPSLAQHCQIPLWQVSGYEADDCIASLARCMQAQGLQVRIASRDKDLDQLLAADLHLWDPISDILRGPEQLLNERGILPEQMADWLCMVGDSADNIPGIRGIGCKSASALLGRYGSLESLLADLPAQSSKRQQALRDFLAQRPLIEDLVRLVDNLFIDPKQQPLIPAERLRIPSTQAHQGLRQWLDEQGIHSARIGLAQAPRLQEQRRLKSLADWQAFSQGMGPDSPYALADYCHEQSLQLAWARPGQLLHWQGPLAEAADPQAWQVLLQIAEDCRQRRLHPILADAAASLRGPAGRLIPAIGGCCVTASWLLNSRFQAPLAQPRECAQLCCTSHPQLLEQLQEQGMPELYLQRYLPLQQCLVDIGQRGISIDGLRLHQSRNDIELLHLHLRRALFRAYGGPCDLRQRRVLERLFFERCAIPPHLFPLDEQGPRFDEKALQGLREDYEIIGLVLDERQVAQLRQRIAPDIAQPHQQEGLIRPLLSFHTDPYGLLHSHAPDLLELPRADQVGREIRDVFVPSSPQEIFLCLRLQEPALLLLQHLSQDPLLADALACEDPWRRIAAQISGQSEATISPKDKCIACLVQEAMLYEWRPLYLAQRCGCTVARVEALLQAYRQHFVAVCDWRQGLLKQAASQGLAHSLGGRRLTVKGLNDDNPSVCLSARRSCLEMTLQGSLADLMHRCILDLEGQLQGPARLALALEYELLICCPRADSAALQALVQKSWTSLLAPVRMLCGEGESWLEASRRSLAYPHLRVS